MTCARSTCLLITILAPLCGCVGQIAQFAAGDATTAASVANAASLPADEACFAAYGAIANALAATDAKIGILTKIETKRALQATMGSQQCMPITLQLLSEILKISSAQGLALGTLLGL